MNTYHRPEPPLDPPENPYDDLVADDLMRYEDEALGYSEQLLRRPGEFAGWVAAYLRETNDDALERWAKCMLRSLDNGVISLTPDERREQDLLFDRVCQYALENDIEHAPEPPRTEKDFRLEQDERKAEAAIARAEWDREYPGDWL